ncbi:MAG: ATP-binding cassette domain-containing protein [Balneolaceae bacterium]|nr:MAG: ATP-binding cassette domain-containing protein [Balneolaceae bacterium]
MLTFSNVTKQYSKVTAVNHLSFSIQKGEIFALLGPNGAGKTTSVRMIMQIIEPDSGKIRFDPGLITGKGVDRRLLGYLPEERGLYQESPILKTLVYLAALRGKEPGWARKEAIKWLERFGLKERMNDKISALSKGNQQKVQFISSILHEPDFVVLDEPFSGFDPINQEFISDCIRELRQSGMTILLSAHQMQLVERIADRILLISDGKELVSGTLEEIRQTIISGQKIVVKYEGDVNSGQLGAIQGISGYQVIGEGEWEVYLNEGVVLNGILSGLALAGTINDLKTAETNLHEIFIHSFKNRGHVDE